jgi:hypothetical protein
MKTAEHAETTAPQKVQVMGAMFRRAGETVIATALMTRVNKIQMLHARQSYKIKYE